MHFPKLLQLCFAFYTCTFAKQLSLKSSCRTFIHVIMLDECLWTKVCHELKFSYQSLWWLQLFRTTPWSIAYRQEVVWRSPWCLQLDSDWLIWADRVFATRWISLCTDDRICDLRFADYLKWIYLPHVFVGRKMRLRHLYRRWSWN